MKLTTKTTQNGQPYVIRCALAKVKHVVLVLVLVSFHFLVCVKQKYLQIETFQFKRKMSTDHTLEIVPTRAMRLKKPEAASEFKAVVFEAHKSKRKNGAKWTNDNKSKSKNDDDALDMKRVRHEVFNFGISGYNFQDQQKAKIALAVKLGAKPPKNKYQNYKELQETKKQVKEKEKEEAYIRTVGKNSAGMATVSCNKLVDRYAKKRNKKQRSANAVGELTKHYGIVNPKIHKKNKRK